MFYVSFITDKTEHISLKAGMLYWWKIAKCVANYSQDKTILSVNIAAKDVLPAFIYKQNGALSF